MVTASAHNISESKPYAKAFDQSAVTKEAIKTNQKISQIKINANQIEVKRKSEVINFNGNVVVEKEETTILADYMRVFYDEKETNKSTTAAPTLDNNGSSAKVSDQSKITKDDLKRESSGIKNSSLKRIEAQGRVKIFDQDMVGMGDEGIYDPISETMTLEKNVTINGGTSGGKGEKFVYNLKTKKGNFIGKRTETVAGNAKNNSKQVTSTNSKAESTNPVQEKIDNRVVLVIGDDIKDVAKMPKDANKKSKTKTKNEQDLSGQKSQ